MLLFFPPKKQLLKLCLLAMLAAFAQRLSAQSGAPTITTPTPPSPNAASLGIYGEIPVGLSSGIPNINIPIYEINVPGMKLPISLDYHGGGIKVEEIASWVGLGWSLNAGGVITRQVRGLADDGPSGYLYTSARVNQYLNGSMSTTDQQEFLQDVLDGITDSQQDVYYYNFGTESGKFIFNSSGALIPLSLSKIKIEFGTFLGVADCWKITSTNGQAAYFTTKEISNSQTQTTGGTSFNTPYNTTSWYLTKLVNPFGTESIDFTYENANVSFKTTVSQTKYHFLGGTIMRQRNDESSFSSNTIAGKRLTKIVFTNGQIDFIKDTQLRSDLPTDYKLNSIVIKNADQSFYKRVNFYNRYTTSTDVAVGATAEESKRLFLDSISTLNSTNVKNGTYEFSYDPTLLPSRNSYNQDHWGYYNDATNGGNFVPATTLTLPDATIFTINGANRSANTATSQAGTLTSITYPLGGRTEFDYENHTANNAPASIDYATNTLQAKILTNGVSTNYSITFTITEGFAGYDGVNADVQVNRTGCPLYNVAGCPLTTLHFPDGSQKTITSNSKMFLPVGTYTLNANLFDVSPYMLENYYVVVKWPKGQYATQKNNLTVGGLRVKKMVNYNPDNSIVGTKIYSYLNPDSVNYSSGLLLSFPDYRGIVTDGDITSLPPNIFVTEAKYLSLSSGSALPIISYQNSAVGYQFVQEKTNDQGLIGKTESEFLMPPDVTFNVFPYAPPISNDWCRGLLKEKNIYRYNTGTTSYDLIRQVRDSYQAITGANYTGVKVGRNYFPNTGTNLDYKAAVTTVRGGQSLLIQELVNEFDPASASNIQAQTANTYDLSNMKVKSVSVQNSRGLNQQTNLTYSFDMVSSSRDPAGIYQAMVNKNMIDPVVEQSEVTNGNTKLQLTNYIQPFTGVFVPGTIDTRNTITGTNETRIRYHSYDNKGNPLSVSKEGGARVNYKWGYNSQYPVAEFSNALPAEFYSQNFESSTTGFPANITKDSVNAHTGSYAGLIANTASTEKYCLSNDYITISAGTERVFNYSGWIYSDGPPAELVLFMYRAGETEYYSYVDKAVTTGTGKWIYISKNFPVPDDVVKMKLRLDNNGLGNIWFDDVRIQPREATSATYTYDPLVGVTSKTDNKGQTAIYEYDTFQRLINIKDQNGNIIKNNSYRIKN